MAKFFILIFCLHFQLCVYNYKTQSLSFCVCVCLFSIESQGKGSGGKTRGALGAVLSPLTRGGV